MRNIPPDLQTHLEQEVTTLCTAWKLHLKDGRVFGFSEHDRDLNVEGVTYLAASSLSESEAESRLGYASDNGAVRGVLTASDITETEIAAGILNEAYLTRLRINWADPTQYIILSVGILGQVTTRGDCYDVEWLGLSTKLDQSTGRVFSKKCDAQFGDSRCGVDSHAYPSGTTCPKTLNACRDQFGNSENYRGFPYLLGDDQLYAAPLKGSRRDGGSRYS